ncbi:glycerophosphodiester phosphodiesterase family protein [Enterovibrio calviensis]|uniref:glycerophosphodiester phosphodiesterase family protein n=1 Tax=Enterovibrio calviensis TaxID=91359 RepID=UPI0004807D0B|nr:glycerophosphodiester phosphodiesterase family protein [Enterovibrio calviensis]
MNIVTTLGLLASIFVANGALASDDYSIGPRPQFLVLDMDDGALKQKLMNCLDQTAKKSDFSIGHRGAPLMFPEHTKESYIAAAKMGAGIVECDVTFTKDKALVCRHSQKDLHTTTDVLAHPDLASKCSVPFTPANPETGDKANVECRTSDFTLAEFKRLKGKMDGANAMATTPEEYMDGTAGWRTDLYASRGTLMTHAESIELFKTLGVKMTPELKAPVVDMPYEGFTQQDYAQKAVEEYKAAGVKSGDVFLQSFNIDDVKYWIASEPAYSEQAVFLDARMYEDKNWKPTLADMKAMKASGVQYIAPPMFALVDLNEKGQIVPSEYAELAKEAGLNMITWTLERSGHLGNGGGWYYQTVKDVTDNDGDMLKLLDVLAKDVGVKGVFSDWPATTTFYANCMGL